MAVLAFGHVGLVGCMVAPGHPGCMVEVEAVVGAEMSDCSFGLTVAVGRSAARTRLHVSSPARSRRLSRGEHREYQERRRRLYGETIAGYGCSRGYDSRRWAHQCGQCPSSRLRGELSVGTVRVKPKQRGLGSMGTALGAVRDT